MKKFRTVLSLALALALVCTTVAPAFASYSVKNADGTFTVYNDDGTVANIGISNDVVNPDGTADIYDSTGTKVVTCKMPDYAIFYVEVDADGFNNRQWALDTVKRSSYKAAYYMDGNGQLWTDMPQYGGVKVDGIDIGNATITADNAYNLPTADGLLTMYERYDGIQKQHWYDVVTADTTPVGFSDVPASAWYADAVNALANTGIIQGDGQGHFLPSGTITWEQAYLIMFRLLGVDGKYLPESIDDTQAPSFATRKHVVDELLDLKPVDDLSRPITRAEAIAVICMTYSISVMNFHAACQYGSSTRHTNGTSWPLDGLWGRNAEAVANGAKEWDWRDTEYEPVRDVTYTSDPNILACAYTIGIVHGVDEKGTLNPYADLTRAEFCQMLYNASIFGPVYPTVYWNSNMPNLQPYLESHYVDGSLVEGYEVWTPPTMGLG